MEFHQIQYFLALSATLNFTKAAELCNISQPALSRAVQCLEHEFGGQLVRREGRLTHLTELGRKVTPMLRESYQMALSAKAFARACAAGSEASLRIAISGTIDFAQVAAALQSAIALNENLEIKILRGSNGDLFDLLKAGEADLAFADADATCWDRLDSWNYRRQSFALAFNADHPFSEREEIDLPDLGGQSIICLPHCGLSHELIEMISRSGRARPRVMEVATQDDLIALLRLNAGVALLPDNAELPDRLKLARIAGVRLEHLIRLWAVAGRQRSGAANAIIRHVHCSSEAAGDNAAQPCAAAC